MSSDYFWRTRGGGYRSSGVSSQLIAEQLLSPNENYFTFWLIFGLRLNLGLAIVSAKDLAKNAKFLRWFVECHRVSEHFCPLRL